MATSIVLNGLLRWAWLMIVATIFTVPGSPPLSRPSVICMSTGAVEGDPGRAATAEAPVEPLGSRWLSARGIPTKASASHRAETLSWMAAVRDAR